MAGLLCLCGAGMNNCTVPSDSIAEIYPKEELDKAIANGVELIDLWNEKWEFWYCQECKRITVIDRNTGKYVRSYFRRKQITPISFSSVVAWKELFFWRDKEFYDATESSWHLTVGDFVKCHPSRYIIRISTDLSIAHVFAQQTKDYLFSYRIDPTPEFLQKTSPQKT